MVFLTDTNTTPRKIVLSCFGLLVGLWQLWLDDFFLYFPTLLYISSGQYTLRKLKKIETENRTKENELSY